MNAPVRFLLPALMAAVLAACGQNTSGTAPAASAPVEAASVPASAAVDTASSPLSAASEAELHVGSDDLPSILELSSQDGDKLTLQLITVHDEQLKAEQHFAKLQKSDGTEIELSKVAEENGLPVYSGEKDKKVFVITGLGDDRYQVVEDEGKPVIYSPSR